VSNHPYLGSQLVFNFRALLSTANVTLTNATDRFILKPDDNGVPNAILTLDNVTLDDRGEYKCIGRNAANVYGGNTTTPASDVTTVRVKGKFASDGCVTRALLNIRGKVMVAIRNRDLFDITFISKTCCPSPN